MTADRYIDGEGRICIDVESGEIELFTCVSKSGLIVIMQVNGETKFKGTIKSVEQPKAPQVKLNENQNLYRMDAICRIRKRQPAFAGV